MDSQIWFPFASSLRGFLRDSCHHRRELWQPHDRVRSHHTIVHRSVYRRGPTQASRRFRKRLLARQRYNRPNGFQFNVDAVFWEDLIWHVSVASCGSDHLDDSWHFLVENIVPCSGVRIHSCHVLCPCFPAASVAKQSLREAFGPTFDQIQPDGI